MTIQLSRSPRRWLAAAALLAASQAALADGARWAAANLPAYQRECASCHVAYPPGLLPAASWERLMQSLPRHFGTDASLDEAQVREISGWLVRNAGSRASVQAAPEDRITRTPWFIREHRKVPQGAWARVSIKSAANCAACHPQADQGDFDEHAIRIPR
jgi:hypothetical protein